LKLQYEHVYPLIRTSDSQINFGSTFSSEIEKKPL
jgi:hypothetical protein